MTQCVSVYSGFTAKVKSGQRRQFGPRRSPERFWRFHRVIGPIRPYGNNMATLICIWDAPLAKLATWSMGTFAVYTAIHGHALRHGPPELYSYTSLYIAIHRYTLYGYTSLYSIQPLQHPSLCKLSAAQSAIKSVLSVRAVLQSARSVRATESSVPPVLAC